MLQFWFYRNYEMLIALRICGTKTTTFHFLVVIFLSYFGLFALVCITPYFRQTLLIYCNTCIFKLKSLHNRKAIHMFSAESYG